MNIRLGLRDNKTTFLPGESIEGAALWEMDSAPSSAVVNLVWFTRGKGSEDSEIVGTENFPDPRPGDTRQFSIRIPEGPYSFSGRLISLLWAVELLIQPGKHFERIDIVIAPGRREVVLPTIAQPPSKLQSFLKK